MKKISVKTFYLIGIICIGLIVLGIGSTYAMFTASAEINNPIAINTTLGSENEIIETIDVKVPAGELKTFTLTINNTSSSTLNYTTWYSTTSSNVLTGVNLSNADSSSPSGSITSGSSKVIYVQIRNEGSEEIDATIGISSSAGSIVLSNSMTQVGSEELYYTLAEHVTNLYTNAEKSTATQSITYNVASSVGLMNDRLGSSSVDADSGNIRYYGASPSNYVYFNCSDYDNQSDSTCELWRIIGVFDGKVKIMRNDSIGNMAWSQNKNTTGTSGYSNDWTTSSLKALLNEKYLYGDTAGTVTYYSGSRGSTSLSLDMSSIGIKNDETRSLISSNLWNLGGYSSYSIYSYQAYTYERGTTVYSGRPTEWTGNIAIPYPSDYGYAADLSKCSSRTLYNYNNSTSSYQCRANDWMFNSSISQWFLMPSSSSSSYLYYATTAGRVTNTGYAYNSNAVRPTTFLIEKSYLIGGDGTSTTPYKLQKPKVVKSNLSRKITKLYTNAEKTTVTNNSITYNTAPSVNLMNDRKGSSSVGADAGNIRYYGKPKFVTVPAWQSTDTENTIGNFDSEESCLAEMETNYNICSPDLNGYENFGYSDQATCESEYDWGDYMFGESMTYNQGKEKYCTGTGNKSELIEPNNYIYFNCSDYSNQSDSTCEKWRIIGVFDGKVKMMRGSTIGMYSWDNKDTTTGAETDYGKNDWTDARLMKLLNPGYESETTGGSLYYNSGSGSCYSGQNNATKTCDFTSTGIKNDTTRNLISDTLYYLGGWNSSVVYSDQIYEKERGTTVYTGRPTSWTGKIALAYPSDYGYAADLGSCNQTLNNYDDSTCTSTNWMKAILGTSSWGWLLTPYSVDSYYVWRVASSGDLAYNAFSPYSARGVAPVLYLGSEQEIESGTGTNSDPYRLSVS